MKSVACAAVFLTLLLALPSCAPPTSNQHIVVTSVWARPAGPGANSAVYFDLQNRGPADVLLGAESTVTEMTMIHRSRIGDDGIVHMEPLRQLEIPPASEVIFEPGGIHVMLVNLQSELIESQTLAISLWFEKTGEVELKAIVSSP
jgi:copper(I)-binding protein